MHTIFQLFYGVNKLHFDILYNDVCFELDRHAQLEVNGVSSLKHNSVGRYVLKSDKIPRFQVNQSFLLFLKTVFIEEKQQISILQSLAACPFTLCRGFFTPKIGPVPPKLQGLSICRGTKLREKQQLYPIVPPVSKLSGHPALVDTTRV